MSFILEAINRVWNYKYDFSLLTPLTPHSALLTQHSALSTLLLSAAELAIAIMTWFLPRVSEMTNSPQLGCKLTKCFHLRF
jgi:hypothetical protein